MKIDASKLNIERAYNINEIRPRIPQKNIENVQKRVTDGVSLKERINKYKQVINRLPEIREEKVKRINEAIKQGTYRVSPKEVAKRMLEDVLGGVR